MKEPRERGKEAETPSGHCDDGKQKEPRERGKETPCDEGNKGSYGRGKEGVFGVTRKGFRDNKNLAVRGGRLTEPWRILENFAEPTL